MIVVARIERRGRIVRRERRRRGLAGDGRPGLLQQHHDRRVRARPKPPVDLRAHFGRKIRGVDDVLDADRDAAQRPGVLRAGVFGAADEGADGFFVRVGGLDRLRDRGIGG